MSNNPNICSTDDVVEFVKNEVEYQLDSSAEDKARIRLDIATWEVELMIQEYIDRVAKRLNIDC